MKKDKEPKKLFKAGAVHRHVHGHGVVLLVDEGIAQVLVPVAPFFAAEVVQDEGDSLQFEPMVEATFKNLKEYPEKVSADGGYWSGEVLEYVIEKKLDAYIAPSGIDPASLKDWTFDETADAYTGPNGDIYIFEKQICKGKRKGKSIIYRTYRCAETGKAKWIQVGIPNYTEMQKKTSTPDGAAVYKWRKAIIEPVFADFFRAAGPGADHR